MQKSDWFKPVTVTLPGFFLTLWVHVGGHDLVAIFVLTTLVMQGHTERDKDE